MWVKIPVEAVYSEFALDTEKVQKSITDAYITCNNYQNYISNKFLFSRLYDSQSLNPEFNIGLHGTNHYETAKLEEEMLAAIQADDKLGYNKRMKDYLILLANTGQVQKLKDYLMNTLMKDELSIERKFLDKIGISHQIIIKNSFKILEKYKHLRSVIEEIQQSMDLANF